MCVLADFLTGIWSGGCISDGDGGWIYGVESEGWSEDEWDGEWGVEISEEDG